MGVIRRAVMAVVAAWIVFSAEAESQSHQLDRTSAKREFVIKEKCVCPRTVKSDLHEFGQDESFVFITNRYYSVLSCTMVEHSLVVIALKCNRAVD